MVGNLTRRLQRTSKDQYILTIPKSLVQILQWQEHQTLSFGFDKGKLILLPNTEQKPTRKLQLTPKGQYTLTLPKPLVQILQWNDKEIVTFGFDNGKISLARGEVHE